MTKFLSKQSLVFAAVASVMSMAMVSGAHASAPGSGDPFDIFFNESGQATVVHNGQTFTEQGVNIGDGFLSYLLPEPVGTGDVGISGPGDPCTDATNCDEGLRFLFDAASGNYYMQYYSDPGTGRADTGLPADFNFGFVGSTEVGGENSLQTFEYHPGGNNYFGISDVPEPATWAMMLIGLAGIGYAARRRARVAAAAV